MSLALLQRVCLQLQLFLDSVLVVLTDIAAAFLSSSLFRRHFHLILSVVLVAGPALSFWVSQFSVFAKPTHFLYRLFLRSGWGWTCVFVGSFVFLLSFSARRSVSLALRHLSRLALAGGLWAGFRRLLAALDNATGSCYERLAATGAEGGQAGASASAIPLNGQPLLLLREGETKSTCVGAGMLWRGYEVSEDIFLLCLCCLLLAEETSVFGTYLSLGRGGPPAGVGGPLRILFLFCVMLLWLWVFLLLCLLAYFPQFPTQLIGGALGCLSWRALYQGWYQQEPSWCCPGLPGLGLLDAPTGGGSGRENGLSQAGHYST